MYKNHNYHWRHPHVPIIERWWELKRDTDKQT